MMKSKNVPDLNITQFSNFASEQTSKRNTILIKKEASGLIDVSSDESDGDNLLSGLGKKNKRKDSTDMAR